jgi:hypothetical protein
MEFMGRSRLGAWAYPRLVSGFAMLATITVASGAHAQQAALEAGTDASAAPPASLPIVAPAATVPAPAAVPVPAAAPAGKARPVSDASRIEVQLDADRTDAGLYRIMGFDRGLDDNFNGSIGGTRRRQRLCSSPCRVLVPPGDFVVWGRRLRESPTFSLTTRSKFVHIDAEVGTEGGAIGGIALSAIGGFTLLISLPIVLVGAVVEARGDEGGGLLIGGGAASAAGAGLLIGGVSMIVGSKTKISLHSTPR